MPTSSFPSLCWTLEDGPCVQQLASLKANLAQAKMIVFDKDGTLGDCSSSLKRWVRHMTSRLNDALEGSMHTEEYIGTFYSAIGWDVANDTVVPSAPIAAGTWQEQVETTAALLQSFGLPPHLAADWHNELGNVHSQDKPVIDNLKQIMRHCHELGLIVAVCTSDDRVPTDMALRHWDIAHLVDFSICGNEVLEAKPSAMPLLQLCEATMLHPSECIMVGDTTADTGMARNASALFCVGVLTGSGTATQLLATGADIVVPHVGHVPWLVEAMGRKRIVHHDVMVQANNRHVSVRA